MMVVMMMMRMITVSPLNYVDLEIIFDLLLEQDPHIDRLKLVSNLKFKM